MKTKQTGSMGAFAYELDSEDGVMDLKVEFEISPFIPGRMHLSNGDPGYPDEGNEIEECLITFRGKDFSQFLTQSELDKIHSSCYDNKQDNEPDYD